jgi:hypothetical protein
MLSLDCQLFSKKDLDCDGAESRLLFADSLSAVLSSQSWEGRGAASPKMVINTIYSNWKESNY